MDKRSGTCMDFGHLPSHLPQIINAREFYITMQNRVQARPTKKPDPATVGWWPMTNNPFQEIVKKPGQAK